MTPWELNFEVAFDVNPGDEPDPADWTDLSDRLWGSADVALSWGSMSDTANLTLLNRDRQLDPTHAGSTYNPIPMRHARLTVDVGESTYPLMRGYAKGFTPVWSQQNEALVDVRMVDAFSWIATQDEDVDLPRQRTHQRITALLDLAGWPAGRRDIEDGVAMCTAAEAQDANLLRMLSDTADAEEGELYVDPSGDVTFRSRHHRFDATLDATLAIFGDGDVPAHDLAIAGVRPDPGTDMLTNIVRMQSAGGDTIVVTDEDSIGTFGRRAESVRDLALPPYEAEGLGQWVLYRFAGRREWFSPLSVDVRRNPGSLPTLLDRRVGDRLKFVHVPPGGGDPVEEDVCVERVSHRIGNHEWIVRFDTEPYFGEGPWAQWETAEASSGTTWATAEATEGPRWAP